MKEIKCELCDKTFKNNNALEMHNNSKHSKQSKKSSRNLIYIGVAVILIIFLFLFFTLKNNNPTSTSTDNNLQKVTLGFDSNYAPNTINVKQGIPVEITLDDSVSGCFRSFRIPELKVFKISTSPNDKILFTPTKPGIYRFQCGMNMGYGTLIVS